jgi:putative flippase GtrA
LLLGPGSRYARFLKFCLVGGASAIASIALMYGLVDLARIPYLPAFVLTFVLVNVCAYAATRRVAFKTSTVGRRAGLVRYFAVTGFNLLVNSALMVLLGDGFGLWPVIAIAMLAIANAPVNFLLHRRVTFAEGAARG